jgi:hypothetical protein
MIGLITLIQLTILSFFSYHYFGVTKITVFDASFQSKIQNEEATPTIKSNSSADSQLAHESKSYFHFFITVFQLYDLYGIIDLPIKNNKVKPDETLQDV